MTRQKAMGDLFFCVAAYLVAGFALLVAVVRRGRRSTFDDDDAVFALFFVVFWVFIVLWNCMLVGMGMLLDAIAKRENRNE